jgi:hypothetical protein
MVVLPPSILMDFIFRRSRPPTKRLNRINSSDEKVKRLRQQFRPTREVHEAAKKTKQPLTLPHYCVYIGWLLVSLSIGLSSFFVFSYSIQWGPERANAWLSSIVLSVVQSVLIVQPIKARLEYSLLIPGLPFKET